MKVHVDPDKCQGHNRCYALAPELFDVDDEGYAFVPDDKAKFEELPNPVKLAVANCPERAISVSEVAE